MAAATAAGTTGTEARTDVRRDQMLRAAAELIAERGFSETRISDVATRAGASPALVVYYFGTKDHLLTEALRSSERAFYAAADELLASRRGIRSRLKTLVRLTCVPRGRDDESMGSWGLWFDLWAQAFRHPEVARDRVELEQRWRDLIARVVRDSVDDGEIDEVDADDFAVTFAALLDGLSIQVALADPVLDQARAQEIAMRFAATSLGF
ncbi:MAG: TetR family transcriptional regulator C-terminal domain-containing protein [Nocardioidaceae bacterium]|nr:TetR family transcriptional regulator C-terminal domain-containing protein [Nocardioidaceae bacterium]